MIPYGDRRFSLKTFLLLAVLCNGIIAYNAKAQNTSAVYVVIHIDLDSTRTREGLALLRAYVQQCRTDPANQSEQLLQEPHRRNHLTLIEGWRNEAEFAAHLRQGYVLNFRKSIQPILGSPFDERLHQAVGP